MAWPEGQVYPRPRRRGRDKCPTLSVPEGERCPHIIANWRGRGLCVITTWREQVPLHHWYLKGL